MEQTKICSKCEQEKPLKEFYKAKECRLGVMAECKECFRERAKAKESLPKSTVIEKACSQCGESKLASAFSAWARSKDGLQAECKDCHNGRSQPIYTRDKSICEKACSQCGMTKAAGEFYDNAYSKTGMDTFCKACRIGSNAQWNRDNPDKRKPIANRSAKKTREDPDKRLVIYAKTRQWQLANPEAVKVHGARDREKAKAKPARMHKKRQQIRQFFVDRPGYRGAAAHKRRALLKNATIVDAMINVWVLYDRDHGTCTLCGFPVDKTATWPSLLIATVDHWIPVSRDGEHSYLNTKLAHHYCNTIKNDRLETPAILASIRTQFVRKFGIPNPILPQEQLRLI